ncbi:hypothetical protein LZ32DRAFT_622199 [Colletotrichum eremochloae]|nr:hypothetical protein LZ32DRAFT_622199 [Colletotrichum eremochloae]
MFTFFFSKASTSKVNEDKWEPLLETPEAIPQSSLSRPSHSRHSIWVGILLLVWTIALLCWSMVLLIPQKTAQPGLISHCGNSTAEAKSLGCTYDTLEQAWVPPDCADPETLVEYQSYDTWHGFNDEYGQQPINIEEMSERTFASRYWIEPLDHGIHCVFTLKRFIKFMDREQEMFSSVSSEEELSTSLASREHHISHCLNLLAHVAMGGSYAQNDDDIQKWSKNRTGFGRCYNRGISATS